MKRKSNKNFFLFKSSTGCYFAILILILSFCFTTSILAQGSAKALDFDGVDDYIFVSNHASLQISSNISLESWVKFSADFSSFSSNYHQGLIDKGNYSIKFDFQSGKLVSELDDAAATSWSLSRNGSENMIEALLTYNGQLYAGQGNGAGAGDVLAYDGSSWSTSLNGLQESIHSLVVYNGLLYAGQGSGTGDGEVGVFDGSTWSLSLNGAQEGIYSLAVYNNQLYAGQGSGTGDGDVGVFDGSTWNSSYNGSQESIHALAVYNGRLYAGVRAVGPVMGVFWYTMGAAGVPAIMAPRRVFSLWRFTMVNCMRARVVGPVMGMFWYTMGVAGAPAIMAPRRVSSLWRFTMAHCMRARVAVPAMEISGFMEII
jgi:hypothetical protein